MKSEETDNQQCCLFCRISVVFLFNILSLFMDLFMMRVCFRFMGVGGRGGGGDSSPKFELLLQSFRLKFLCCLCSLI